MRRVFRCAGIAAALIVGVCLHAATDVDGELQYQLGSVLVDQTRYREAVDAFDRASQSADAALAMRARKGKVRAALRIAEFGIASEAATALRALPRRRCRGHCALRRRAVGLRPVRRGRHGVSAGAAANTRFRSRAVRARPFAGDDQPAERGARRGAGRIGRVATGRRNSRAAGRAVRADASLRRGRQRAAQLHQPDARQGPS